jgi:hypothetical protein
MGWDRKISNIQVVVEKQHVFPPDCIYSPAMQIFLALVNGKM